MGRKSLAKERRAQITSALYRCIARDGLQRASTREIAREAGVQPSILHHYFKDRAEMIEEVVRNIVDDLIKLCDAEISRYENPATRFDKAIDFLFGPDMVNADHTRFFYDCWAEAKTNDKVRASFVTLYARFRDAIIDLLVETNTSEDLTRTQLKDLANIIVAIQDGVSLQWEMDREHVSLPRMSLLTKRMIALYVEDARRSRKRTEKRAKKS